MKSKILILALVSGLSFAAINAQAGEVVCRVVTYNQHASLSAKATSAENLKAGEISERVYYFSDEKVYAIEYRPEDKAHPFGGTLTIGTVNGNTVISSDGVNSSIFTFEPSTRTYLEADTFTPNEQQQDQYNLKSSATIYRGTYEACSPAFQQTVLNAIVEGLR